MISLQSKGLSRVFSSTAIQKHLFFGTQSSLWSNSHIHIWLKEFLIIPKTQNELLSNSLSYFDPQKQINKWTYCYVIFIEGYRFLEFKFQGLWIRLCLVKLLFNGYHILYTIPAACFVVSASLWCCAVASSSRWQATMGKEGFL